MQFFKNFLRLISEALTLNPKIIGVIGVTRKNHHGLKARLVHFACNGSKIQFATPFGIFQCENSLTEHASKFLRLRMFYFCLLGRILVLNDSPLWMLLQRLLPFKVFICNWDGHFRNSSWRFHEICGPRRFILKQQSNHALNVPLQTIRKKVILLGTGPSAGLIFSEEARNYDVITCNSAVKSRKLFEHVNVVAHCFSDATFMLGASEYSHQFLIDLRSRIGMHDFLVVHDSYHTNFLNHFLRKSSRGNLAPIFLDSCNLPIITFDSTCRQFSFTNVFTALMLPVALTWYDEIVLIGFDGKGKEVNYFWQHQDEFQYQSLLPTVREWDPGFFVDVDYNKYSADHETMLSGLIKQALMAGKKIHSANESNSHCIHNLYSQDIHEAFKNGLFQP